MERFVGVNEHIVLKSGGTDIDFCVKKVLGVGGGCVAYSVLYLENGDIPHMGVLKEYCPAFLEEDGFSRNGTVINIPEKMKDFFEERLTEFKNTYKYINEYLSGNIAAANYHPVQIGLYEGNNTAYTLTSCDYGKNYDEVDDGSLLSICKIMLSVTKAVELYHNAGFLHLDIKPKNILMLNDVTELVKLFDYDSLTSIEMLKKGEAYAIPSPETYYVPELERCDLREIDIQTDIFEIGAMMFLKIFKRAPEISDMSYDSKYDLDKNELFVGISPQAKNEIAELLKQTVQISKRLRFKTTKELKDKLEKIISLISDEKPYLIDLPKWQPSKYCVGRSAELKEIKRRLDNDGYVFVKGIGGLGKSEIAKLFAQKYADEYHTVQFCKYTDSLTSLLATMPINGIDDANYVNADELVKAKNKVLHLCDSKTLIIVDNFNVTYDDFLRDFLPQNNQSFKVIFTTRCAMAAEYYDSKTYDLPKLSLVDCKKLYFAHYSATAEDEAVERLIEFVDYNTLIIVLAARAAKKSGFSVNDMLAKLEAQETDSLDTSIFHEYDFSSDEVNAYNKINAHLVTIFSVSKLTALQKEILKNATLISLNGIGLDEFVQNCRSAEINRQSVENVIDLGWLNKDFSDVITMHPIVSDLLAVNKDLVRAESYEAFAEYLEDFCNPEECHFSIVLNKLACAKHLYRRYKFEKKTKYMMMTLKLGRMYENTYQPNDARKYLKEGLERIDAVPLNEQMNYEGEVLVFDSESKIVFKAYAYYFLGSVEKDFGTKDKAIECFRSSLAEMEKMNEFSYHLVVEALGAIGECYRLNNNNLQAYDEYLKALNYAKKYDLKEFISDVASILIEICDELGWTDKIPGYQEEYDRYSYLQKQVVSEPIMVEANEKIDSNDFIGYIKTMEKVLETQREALGEDSPQYKELSDGRWMYYFFMNQNEQAHRALNDTIAFVEQSYGKESLKMAELLSTAGSLMRVYDDFSESKRFSERAVEICEKNGFVNEYTYVEAILNLASVYVMQKNFYEAKALIGKIDISKFSGKTILRDFIGQGGNVLMELGEFEEIEPLCREMLSKDDDGDITTIIAKYHANLILLNIFAQKGDYDTAIAYAEEAKKYVGDINNMYKQGHVLVAFYISYSAIYWKKGDVGKAISIASEFIESLNENERNNFLVSDIYSSRGMYYLSAGKKEKAQKDFETCKKILSDNNASMEAFAVVLNNEARLYQELGEYKKANEIYREIIDFYPQVLTPKAYFEAVVCNNIGWVECNLNNLENAAKHLNAAVKAFDLLGACNTRDYFAVKNNLGITYLKLDEFEKAIEQFYDMRKNYNPESDESGKIAEESNFGIMFSLFKMKKAKEAYGFARDELNRFEKWFGKLSPIRVKMILQTGDFFRGAGYPDCYEFFFMADKLIEESEDFKSINNAKLLNYLGCYYTDELKKHGFAASMFKKSKALFEELNATDDETYQTVLSNIEYADDLTLKELIRKMAEGTADQ